MKSAAPMFEEYIHASKSRLFGRIPCENKIVSAWAIVEDLNRGKSGGAKVTDYRDKPISIVRMNCDIQVARKTVWEICPGM